MKINYFGLALGLVFGALVGDLFVSFVLPQDYSWATNAIVGLGMWAGGYIGARKLPK
ncbi:hypothetical protein PN836_020095 [Ningiella sp. W23]|uniref:hypothetical protein n=1 Tax=Ningiella sp. W23 TaxID=3023715 RepID=UPI00375670D7